MRKPIFKVIKNSVFLIFFISAVLGCRTKKIEINSIADLDGKTIGCQIETTGEQFLLKNTDPIKIKTFRDGNEACLALKNNEIDAVILDEFPSFSIVKNNKDLKIVDLNLPAEKYAVAVRKGNKELLDSINSTIRKMKDGGTFDMLKNSFMPSDGNIMIPEFGTRKYPQTIRMGTNAAFPPFEYTNGTNVVGFDVSFAKYIANDLNKNLLVFDMSFPSLFDALEAGSIDFICAGLTETEERKEYVDFSEPYFTTKQVVIVRK